MTTTVILLLGFGIGANAALFSVIRAVLLAPIPGVRHSDSLVRVRRVQNGRAQGNAGYPDYVDYRDGAKTLDGLIAERLIQMRLSGPPAQLIASAIVTGNYFSVLGVKPAAGRLFTQEDDRVPDGHPVAVISDTLWRRQFGGAADVVGRKLVLNGYPFIVVGVAAGFAGVEFGESTAIWIPMAMVKQAMPRNRDYAFLSERRAGWLTYYGRLKPGVPAAAAESELKGIAHNLEVQYPESNRGRGVRVDVGADRTVERRAGVRDLLLTVSIAVCLVLLIACGNVASLQLSRAAARGREMAIRLAIGAGRAALVRQLLTESLLLGLAGGGLGLLLAPWMVTGLRGAFRWEELPRTDAAVLDPTVLLFALGVSLAAVLLAGVAPVWFAARTDPAAALKQGAPSGRGRARVQSAWVVAQVTLSVALVTAGTMMLRSMQRVHGIDPGYRAERIALATIDLSVAGYTPERGTQFFLDLKERVERLPGVRSVSMGKSSPALDWSDRVVLFRNGEAPPIARDYGEVPGGFLVDRNIVMPDYFRTLGIPLLAGRDFARTDGRGTRPVAILSQALAAKLWPGANPLGQSIVMPSIRQPSPEPVEVVGVVADSRYRSILNAPVPLLYSSVLQEYDSIARVMAAVEGDPAEFKTPLLRALHEADPELPVGSIETMQEQIARMMWRQRAAATLLTFFGVLALGLACAGVYGMVAYTVTQRTREIGIRMALGADRAAVVGRVTGQALRLTGLGIVLGLPVVFWTHQTLAAFLYRTETLDIGVMAAVPLLFGAVALAASFAPSRRAATIDPAISLRQE